jgi:hypothetical protein
MHFRDPLETNTTFSSMRNRGALPRAWVLVAVMVTVALPAATALPSVGE